MQYGSYCISETLIRIVIYVTLFKTLVTRLPIDETPFIINHPLTDILNIGHPSSNTYLLKANRNSATLTNV